MTNPSEDEAYELWAERGLVPLEPYPGSQVGWRSRCATCEREVSPRFSSLKGGRVTACRHCTRDERKKHKRSEQEARELWAEHDLVPLEPYPGGNGQWRSKHTPCDREVQPSFSQIKGGWVNPCKHCAKEARWASLPSEDEARALWASHSLEPQTPYPGANFSWSSVHTVCGRTVQPSFSGVKSGNNHPCQYCAREQYLAEFRRKTSATAHALWLKLGLEPLEPYRTAKTPWRSIHKRCGEEVRPIYDNLRWRERYECRHCAARFGVPERRRTETAARALWEKKSFLPLVDYPGSGEPWLSIHVVCGKEISPSYSSLKDLPLDRGCRHCAFNAPVPEELAWKEMREAGWEPLVAYPGGTNYPWLSRCTTCGEEAPKKLASVRAGEGCQTCWFRGMADILRDANESRMRAAFVAKGLTPVGEYRGGNEPWESICSGCGEVTSPRPANILWRKGVACHHCSDSAFGFWTGGTVGGLYVIEHMVFNLLKIGVFREGSARVENFKRAGWREIKVWEGLDKRLVYTTEQFVIKVWKTDGITGLVPPELMRGHGGHTEVVQRDAVDTAELVELLDISLLGRR